MKTKILFIGLLLICFSGFQLTAEPNPGNGATQGWTEGTYWSPVFCNGQLVDVLEGGHIMLHYVLHIKDGFFFKEIDQLKGEVTSGETGETFKIVETDRTYFDDAWLITWHFSLIGDMGTHYVGTITYNYANGEISYGNAICN
ncbi:hypothetical protein ACE1ET_06620 [Saccharicrinis sp. FJH62]|uniref:hypothetical protein n=1 Tax=Saccharicrinis sp. FJH62 TaxID=3344657 RepID=UPI0035D3FDF9